MGTGKSERAAAAGRTAEPDLPGDGPMSHDDIARRAYELYLARGRTDGNAIDDWLQAERELRAPGFNA